MEENRIPEVGDRVKVIDKICGHEFEIGEVIIITEVSNWGGDFLCKSLKNSIDWWLRRNEFELLEELPK